MPQNTSHILSKFVTIISCLLLGLLLIHPLYAQSNTNSDIPQEIKLVWSADYGNGEQVYISSYEKGNWTPPVQLSDSTEMVYHSAISSGDDGRMWAVWARQSAKKKSYLEFTEYSASKWSKPRKIITGLDSNKAVTIIVDKDNVPWIAWEGVDKKYSDIFLSHWNGQGWDTPVKVHADNDVPDIDPALSLDASGRVVLSWQTFANGKYISVDTIFDGQQWQTGDQDSGNSIKNRTSRKAKHMPPIPGFIKEPRRSSVFIKDSEGAQSVPVSDF